MNPSHLAAVMAGQVVVVCATVLGLTYLAIAAHEAGHVLGGLLVGFRFQFCVVGPLRIARDGGRLRIGLAPEARLTGGLASTTPVGSRHLLLRRAVVVAAGPATSLLLAAGAAAVYAGLDRAVGPAHSFAEWWQGLALVGTCGISLLVFAMTTLPSRGGGACTDRAALEALLRSARGDR
jgi:hypothetical protein